MKNINKELKKFESNKDRLKYLEDTLKQTKDKKTKENILDLINDIIQSLEEKIEEQLTEEVPVRREFLEEIETPRYQTQQPTETLEQEVSDMIPLEEPSEGYSPRSYGLSGQSYDTTIGQEFENVSDQARDKLTMQDDISDQIFTSESGMETLGKKVQEMSPGISEEEKITYVKGSTSFNPDKKDVKYVKKLK